jgi:hypothetical protein
MKNAVFLYVTPCCSCNNRRSEELSASIIRVARIGELGTTLAYCIFSKRASVAANIILSSPTPVVTLMIEALRFSET